MPDVMSELTGKLAEIATDVKYLKEKIDKHELLELRLRDIENKMLISESRSSVIKTLSNPIVGIVTSVVAAVSAVIFKSKLGF